MFALMRAKKKLCLVVAVFALMFAIQVASVEAGGCEDALMRCVHDPINTITLGGPFYCAIGYLFCQKYLR